MEAVEWILDILFFLLKGLTVYFGVIALFTLRRSRRIPRTDSLVRFAVVIAARNEETVIADPVRSVLAQDYPCHLRDVYVVPNNCTDQTEEVAAAAGAKIIACRGTVRSKGDALHDAFAQLLKEKSYDAFLVLDADNTLKSDYLARMNDAFAAGAMICKSKTKASNPTASGVAGCYGLYNAVCDLMCSRPRAACGLSAKLIGTGFAVRREVLEQMGGWNTTTIAEDAEFAAQCARTGYRVTWVPEAVNYDEEPVDFVTSLHQRRRWCSGLMQVGRKEIPRLWRTKGAGAMLRWDMVMFLLAPFGQAISGLLLAVSFLCRLITEGRIALLPVLTALSGFCLGCMVLAAVLCLLGGYGLRGMLRAIWFFPFFMVSWLPLQVISLFRDTTHWRAITHTGQKKHPCHAVRDLTM